jgi:nitrate reductase delta subunit
MARHSLGAVTIAVDEAMDDSWAEPEAFGGCSTRGQAKPGEAQPIHIVRNTHAAPRVAA